MKKSEAYDLIVRFDYARRLFSKVSLGKVLTTPRLFDDLGFILSYDESEEFELEIIFKKAKIDILLEYYELDWLPNIFRGEAFHSLLMLMRAEVPPSELRQACQALTKKYKRHSWLDTEMVTSSNLRPVVIFPVASKHLFSGIFQIPNEKKILHFYHDKEQVLESLDDNLGAVLGVVPEKSVRAEREILAQKFSDGQVRLGRSDKQFVSLAELIYLCLVDIQRQGMIQVIEPYFDSLRSFYRKEKTVVASTSYVYNSRLWVHYKNGLLVIMSEKPDIGLPDDDYRLPMLVA